MVVREKLHVNVYGSAGASTDQLPSQRPTTHGVSSHAIKSGEGILLVPIPVPASR